MRTTRDTLLGEAAEECGVPGGGPVVAAAGQVCTLRPHRGGWQGLWQAGGRGSDTAQTP